MDFPLCVRLILRELKGCECGCEGRPGCTLSPPCDPPANPKQNPVFNFNSRDRLEAQAVDPAPSQQSVDMLGILLDNLTPEASAQSENSDISPAKPRDLMAVLAVFADISARLISSVCTPLRSQQFIPEPRKHRYVDHPCQV